MRKPLKDKESKEKSTSGAVASETDPADSTTELAAKEDDDEEDVEEVDGVFLEDDQEVKFIQVTTGVSDQQYIEITSGLEEGQVIVTGSYKTLRSLEHGDKVKPNEKKKGDETENSDS